MRRDKEMRQIALQVSIALAAGMFSIVPVAYGAPVGGTVVAGGASYSYADAASGNGGKDTNITSNTQNNVIDWQDFSVAQGEVVKFDNGVTTGSSAHNYMNIVSGANTSNINGAIKGGNEVYIINPHGVIFGENASVDVGSLYASTRYVSSDAAVAAATAGDMTAVIADTSAGVATDVVNMGTINAKNVVMEGQNIRFYSDNVTAVNGVVLKADTADGGYVHIANSEGAEVTGYSTAALTDGGTAADPEYYKLIDGTNWSTAINNDLTGKYMLSANIDASTATDFAPITGSFSGKIDGNLYEISNITGARGLFYTTNGATIENIGVTASTFTTASSLISADNAVGSIVANATDTTIKNVHNRITDSTQTVTGPARYTGGLVGTTTGTVTITDSYNTAAVSGLSSSTVAVGGLVGSVSSGTTTVNNSYSTGSSYGSVLGYMYAGTANFTNTYSVGQKFVGSALLGATHNINNSMRSYNGSYYGPGDSSTANTDITDVNALSVYSTTLGWGSAISNTGGVTIDKNQYILDSDGNPTDTINTNYGAVTRPAWRIYEGQSTPILTSQFKGIKTTTYDFAYFDSDGAVDSSALLYNNGSNGGADIGAYTGLTSENLPDGLIYNGETFKIVDSDQTAATATDGVLDDVTLAITTVGNSTVDASHILYGGGRKDATYSASTSTQNKLALLYSDQSGYDLVGNNISIAPRTITTSTDLATQTVVKEYDGTADASSAVSSGLFSGDSTTVTGILDVDADTVTLSFDGSATFYKDGDSSAAVGVYQSDTAYVDISGTITLNNGGNNYILSGDGSISGQAMGAIYQKAITVSLADDLSLDKTYDKNAVAKGIYDNAEINGGNVTTDDFVFDDSAIISTTSGEQTTSEDVSLKVENTNAYYVDDDDNQITSAGTHKVKFSGLKLDGEDAANYKLVDESGNVLYSEVGLVTYTTDASGTITATQSETGVNVDAGGSLYDSGTIGRRNISSTGFVWYNGDGIAQDATREYNGEVTYTAPVGFTVSNASTSSGSSGMLEGDDLTFTVQAANFVTSATELTAGTTKNVANAAGVNYTVQITGDAAENYTLDGSDIVIGNPNNVLGEGSITPRTLNVITNAGSYAVKPYDGDAKVKSTNSAGETVESFGIDDGYLAYEDASDTDHHLLTDDESSIVITGAYLQTGNDAEAKDVNYTVSTATNADATTYTYATTDKNITYTATVYENGEASENYVFSTGNDTTATFSGTGRINPAAITAVTFADVEKTYDGSYAVTNTYSETAPLLKNDKITITAATGLIDGETLEDLFGATNGTLGDSGYVLAEDSTLLTGEYGTLSGSTFNPDENVARDTSGNVIAKDVQYTGLSNLLANRNYTLSDDISTAAYGAGTINPFTITDESWIVLDRNDTAITKVYDGSESVAGYTTDGTAVTADTYLNDDKAYITPNNGTTILDADVTVAGANYDSMHSGGSAAQDVTYLIAVANTGNYTVDSSLLNSDGYVEKVLSDEGVITPRPITITTDDIVDSNITKVYDSTVYVGGDTAGAISGESLLTFEDQMIAGDGNSNATTAVYNTPGASTVSGDKIVTYTPTVTGTDSTDYYFRNSDGVTISTYDGTGTIEKRPLTVSFGAVTKVYDRNANVTDTITPTVTNALTADEEGIKSAIVSGVSAAYDDENVGANKTVTYSDLLAALGDTYNSNYKFTSDEATGSGSITAASVTMSDFVFTFADVTRVYNADDKVADSAQGITAEQFMTGAYINLGGGTYSLAGYYSISDAFYNDANAGENKNVTYKFTVTDPGGTNFTITDFDSDYYVNNPVTLQVGTITPRAVYATINNPTVTKVYNAYTDVQINGAAPTADQLVTLAGLTGYSATTGLAGTDSNATTAFYTDQNQGTDKLVTYTVAINDGNSGNNYNIYYSSADTNTAAYTMGYVEEGSSIISTVTTHNNIITPRDLVLTFGDVTKEYDGTTSVLTSQVAPSFDTVQGMDSISLTGYNAVYNSPNVTEANTVYYTNITISGNDDGNYNLVDSSGNAVTAASTVTGAGTITPLDLSGDLTFTLGAVTKEYNNDTDVQFTGTVGGVEYYRDNSTEAVKNYITAPTRTVNGISQQMGYELYSAQYDNDDASVGTHAATFQIGIRNTNYNMENVTINGNAADSIGTNGVYYFHLTKDNATITPRKVYVSLSENLPTITKTYDGDRTIDQNVSNMIIAREGDLLADGTSVNNEASVINAQYDTKDAGDKTVIYNVELTGAGAGNYEIHRLENLGTDDDTVYSTLEGVGTITKATLTFNPDAIDKPYDGTSGIVLDADALQLTGVTVGGVTETVTLTDGALAAITGTYGKGGSEAAFESDANVSWNGNTVADKDVQYTGLSAALDVMNSSDATNTISKNYTIADTAYFTAAQAKGKIKPIAITNAAVENWTPITREYNADTDLTTVYERGSTSGNTLGIHDILKLTLTDSSGNTVTDSSGNALTVTYTATGSYDDKIVGDNKTLNFQISSVTWQVADSAGNKNYVLDDSVLNSLQGATLTSDSNNQITARQLNGSVTNPTGNRKIYDGSRSADASNFVIDADDQAVLQKDGLLNDVVITALYDTKEASVDPDEDDTNTKDITYSLSMSTANSNYAMPADSTAQGDIERRKVYVDGTSATGINKDYDGTTALPDGIDYNSMGFALRDRDDSSKTGLVAGEEAVTLDSSNITGSYTRPNVNRAADGSVIARDITFTGFELDDSSAASDISKENYILIDANGSGIIRPLPLSVTIAEAPRKTYDGTTTIKGTAAANENLVPYGLLAGENANILINSANYNDANAGTNKGYTYNITLGNENYTLVQGTNAPDISVSGNGLKGKITANDGTIEKRIVTPTVNGMMPKVYDGTTDGTQNAVANVSLGNVINGDNVGLTAKAVYDNPNAGKSEGSAELQNHKVTYTLNLSNPNYKLAADTITGTGTISRKGLNIVATPVSINSGEAMPKFSGTVGGFVAGDMGLASGFTFGTLPTVTNMSVGSNPVYGWYRNQTAGNYGLNYTFSQDAGNETAFTVQANRVLNDNPDTKITPSSNIYNQISKDMNSGFGDKGAAAIEYKDKSGNVIARENINSGEIHGVGVEGGNDTEKINMESTTLANIGIAGGDIVNMEGADAASIANVEVEGDGSVVNLEVFSLTRDEQSGSNGAAEITSSGNGVNDGSKAVAEIELMDEIQNVDKSASAAIQIVDESGKVLKEDNEDKTEKKEKKGEIAIESSNSQVDDEIELKTEGKGVNVA